MHVRSIGFLLAIVALPLALAGCPKRPVTTVAQAPAPVTPAPVPMAPAPAAPAAPAPAPAPLAPPAAPAPAPAQVAPTPAAPPREYAEHEALKDIRFDFDRADIRPGDARILDATAAWLTANPRQIVLVEGHCDERGSNEYNLALGERRARAAVNYLVSKGVDGGRFTSISYGEERPSCTQKNEACWAANRRAHFLVKER